MLFLEYPKCSTCKKAKKWLDEQGISYEDRHIIEDNPTAEELKDWHERSGLPLQELAIPEEVSLLLLLKSRSLQEVWARQAMISKKLLTKSHRLLPLWIKNKKYSDVNLR